MIDKKLQSKINTLVNKIMQMSGDLSELQDDVSTLCDEVYDNGCDDGYNEAKAE
jgi:hypothetical protein